MNRSEIRITYIIKQDDELDNRLQEIDTYVKEIKPSKAEEAAAKKAASKISVVSNPKWSTQLNIELSKLIKFETKENCTLNF